MHIWRTKRPIWKHKSMFLLHWGANAYFEYTRLYFSLIWANCRPKNVCLSVLGVYPRVQWYHLITKPLELLTSSIQGTITFENSKSKWYWHSWIFWNIVNGCQETLPSNVDPKVKKWIPKTRQEGYVHHWLWFGWTTNLQTSRVAKDQRRHRKLFTKSTKQRVFSTFYSFAANIFTCNMQEGNDLLDNVNNIKVRAV